MYGDTDLPVTRWSSEHICRQLAGSRETNDSDMYYLSNPRADHPQTDPRELST